MRRKNKNHYTTCYNHIYNISLDNGIIFYCANDYLVFLSVIKYYAERYNVTIVSICLMVNHFHIFTKPLNRNTITLFVKSVTSQYTRLYNQHYERKGTMFKRSYGYSQKNSQKNIRTTISYILNNPVEKRLEQNIEKYRWNFIAYSKSLNPFSKPIVLRNSRWALKKAVKIINSFESLNNILSYPFLERLFLELDNDERSQILDYIVSLYNCIDFDTCLSFYGGDYNQLLIATNSNTGSDYDLTEEFDRSSDLPYNDIASKLQIMGYNWEEVVFEMDRGSEEFIRLIANLNLHHNFHLSHLKKYFHI